MNPVYRTDEIAKRLLKFATSDSPGNIEEEMHLDLNGRCSAEELIGMHDGSKDPVNYRLTVTAWENHYQGETMNVCLDTSLLHGCRYASLQVQHGRITNTPIFTQGTTVLNNMRLKRMALFVMEVMNQASSCVFSINWMDCDICTEKEIYIFFNPTFWTKVTFYECGCDKLHSIIRLCRKKWDYKHQLQSIGKMLIPGAHQEIGMKFGVLKLHPALEKGTHIDTAQRKKEAFACIERIPSDVAQYILDMVPGTASISGDKFVALVNAYAENHATTATHETVDPIAFLQNAIQYLIKLCTGAYASLVLPRPTA